MFIESPVIFHGSIAGTPFQGLILRSPIAMCAYIGVPSDHCLANMENLHFECESEITYRDYGDDFIRPSGFFWYGWVYDMPVNVDQLFGPDFFGDDAPPDLVKGLKMLSEGKKHWTVEEVQCDLIDSAMSLKEVLERYESTSLDVIAKASSGESMQVLRDEANALNRARQGQEDQGDDSE